MPPLQPPQAHRSRRPHAQPEERRCHAAARQADHRHRRQRVGQVVARLRHDLRRRAAPLRRVAVGLRAAVSRADGEAGRRRDRGHLPGDRDPPEEQHPQSALDRRHHHRDPRLHAAALRAGRPDVLPAVRRRSRARNGRGRGARLARAARRHAAAASASSCRSSRCSDATPAERGRRATSGDADDEPASGDGARLTRRRPSTRPLRETLDEPRRARVSARCSSTARR